MVPLLAPSWIVLLIWCAMLCLWLEWFEKSQPSCAWILAYSLLFRAQDLAHHDRKLGPEVRLWILLSAILVAGIWKDLSRKLPSTYPNQETIQIDDQLPQLAINRAVDPDSRP